MEVHWSLLMIIVVQKKSGIMTVGPALFVHKNIWNTIKASVEMGVIKNVGMVPGYS